MAASGNWDASKFKVGDILDATFTYTAQIPHFYIVTRTSASSIWVKPLGKIVVSDDGYGQNGTVVPDKNRVGGNETIARIKKTGYVSINGNTARIWDGRPVMFYTD